MASFRCSFVALHPDAAHQRHSGWGAAAYFSLSEYISVDHDQIMLDLNYFAAGNDYGRGKRYKKRPLLSPSVSAASCLRMFLCEDYATPLIHRTIPVRPVPSFLGRLKFLARLPVEKRNQLLDKTSENTNSTDVKKLISLLRDSFRDENPNWDGFAFKEKAQAFLFSHANEDQRKTVL